MAASELTPCPVCGVLVNAVAHDMAAECLPHLRARLSASESSREEAIRERDEARASAWRQREEVSRLAERLDTAESALAAAREREGELRGAIREASRIAGEPSAFVEDADAKRERKQRAAHIRALASTGDATTKRNEE